MPGYVRKIITFLVSAVLFLLAGAKLVIDMIGRTTVGGDASALQQSLPEWALFLQSLPGWIFVLPLLALVALNAWAIWPDMFLAKALGNQAAESEAQNRQTHEKMRDSNDKAWEIKHELALQREEYEKVKSLMLQQMEQMKVIVAQMDEKWNERYQGISHNFIHRGNYSEEIGMLRAQIENFRGESEEWARIAVANEKRDLRQYITDELSFFTAQYEERIRSIEAKSEGE